MLRLLALLVFLLGVVLSSSAWASDRPRAVSLCDLERDPKQYKGQLIEVRGTVVLEFEGFYLEDPACTASTAGSVWLGFGGDLETPTAYCCGRNERKKGVNVRVEGQPIPLIKNKLLHDFVKYIEAERIKPPNGEYCTGWHCHFYKVTATLRGRFFARDEIDPATGPQFGGGYGHMGCCHLLAIEEVTAVSAARTQVPAGGEFECSTETWEPTPAESEKLRISTECDNPGPKACNTVVTSWEQVARHWDDTVDPKSGYGKRDRWTAADLLTAYSIDIKEDDQGVAPPHVSVIRQRCRPKSSEVVPHPLAERISCQNYQLPGTFDEAQAEAKARAKTIYRQILHKKQLWRLDESSTVAWQTLQEKSRRWRINPDSRLLFKCDDGSELDGDRITGCSWYSPDDMQAFNVVLIKFGFLRESEADWNSVPWIATNVTARICGTERP